MESVGPAPQRVGGGGERHRRPGEPTLRLQATPGAHLSLSRRLTCGATGDGLAFSNRPVMEGQLNGANMVLAMVIR